MSEMTMHAGKVSAAVANMLVQSSASFGSMLFDFCCTSLPVSTLPEPPAEPPPKLPPGNTEEAPSHADLRDLAEPQKRVWANPGLRHFDDPALEGSINALRKSTGELSRRRFYVPMFLDEMKTSVRGGFRTSHA